MDKNTLKYYKSIGLIQSSIAKSSSLDEALKNGLKIVLENTSADYAVMWYLNREDNELSPYYWICPQDLSTFAYKISEGIVGNVFKNKNVHIIKDFVNEKNKELLNRFSKINITSYICVPFSSKNTDLGCIEFIKSKDKNVFTDEEIDACQILTLLCELSIDEVAPRLLSPKNKKVLMTINDLCKEFKNGELTSKVLKGVNFEVFEGELLCFLGESGCGKSTILNIIGGLDKATSGSFTFMGKDYSGCSEEELTKYRRDNIGFIFQSYNLMPNLTAKQNLDLIAELVEDALDTTKALGLVGLADKANSYPSQLSGGQQQRISIARALIKKPKLIMADEPTAALDYETSIEVLTSLENIVKEGSTLIMVTHNEEITKMADRVIRFRDGKTYEITINHNPAKAIDLVW